MASRQQHDIPKAKFTLHSLKRTFRLFQFIKKSDRWLFALGTLFLALTAVTALLFPDLLGRMVDSYTDMNKLTKVATSFLWLFIAQAVFSFLRIGLYVRVAENLTFNLRKRLYSSLIYQPMEFFHQNRTGELLSRFTSDIGQIQDTFTSNLAMFMRQLLVIVGGVIYLFVTSNKLALYMLATVPIVVVISLFFGKYIRRVSKEVQDLTASNTVIAEETFTGIQNVKAFTNESYESRRYTADVENLRKKSIYRGLLRGAFSSFIIVCLFGSIVWLIFQGLGMVRSGDMAIGELISFMFFTGFVGGSIGGMAEQFVQVQKTMGAVERVLDLMEKPQEFMFAWGQSPLIEQIKGGVEFRNVSFNYPSRPDHAVLKNLSFRVEQGQTLAVVGPSGAGKSTLVNLLFCFYKPSNGSVFLGNVEASDANIEDFRANLGLVPQEVLLFGGTIYENILYGNPHIANAQTEVEAAARKANAHDFIMSFPDGYQTLVGDRGIRLSGGQRQRIAIARAILRNPNFLVLDEATSSLDSESEIQVQGALKELMKGRTSIVIAHRLSTIRHADKIVVLKAGEIAEQGSHDELMKRDSGLYRRMVEQQMDPEAFFSNA